MEQLYFRPFLIVFTATGLSLILASLMMKYNPPKKVNRLYGYRTKLSMSSQKLWDEAQLLSQKMLFKQGLVCIILSIISAFLPQFADVWEALVACIIISLLIFGGMRSIESKLKKH